jgi:hypothetical protein
MKKIGCCETSLHPRSKYVPSSFRYPPHERGLDYIPVLGGSWLLWRTCSSGSLKIFTTVSVLVSALVLVLEIWPNSHFGSASAINSINPNSKLFSPPQRNYLKIFPVPVLEPGPGSILVPEPDPFETQFRFQFPEIRPGSGSVLELAVLTGQTG